MRKGASFVHATGGADGPTSVFLLKRNQKLTWKQKLQKFRNRLKRAYVVKALNPGSHTMDEVMEYIRKHHGFVELTGEEIKEEYRELRASFLMQYTPELLGEYQEMPKLQSESPEDIQEHLRKFKERQQRAMEVPTDAFDIEFHKFIRTLDGQDNEMYIIVEKKFAYIGGGCSGNKKITRKFRRIYKDVYRYYGVSGEDIENKTKRYKDVVRTLSM